MKTSLNELRLIEDYLLSGRDDEESALFEAKLILDPEFKERVYWQNKTYQIIHEYGREQVKIEIEKIHQTLFTTKRHQPFRYKIMRLFSK